MAAGNESSGRLLRIGLFLACAPSGGALLWKVYGLGSMSEAMFRAALPCAAILMLAWLWARRTGRRRLVEDINLGLLGGLLGTIGYDLVRVPFAMMGRRIFAPISAYGLWILDAPLSDRFTEVVGWSYHFYNGICFGIMYALFLRGRHWIWAVLWAFLLETIAVVSPFARIFSLSGNYGAIALAYAAHVDYGAPLGAIVRNGSSVARWMSGLPRFFPAAPLILAAAAVAGPLTAPSWIERDSAARAGEFVIGGTSLHPDWLRINRGDAIIMTNPGTGPHAVEVRDGPCVAVSAGSRESLSFPEPGVFQVFVRTDRRTRSSFVIVEPAEEAR